MTMAGQHSPHALRASRPRDGGEGGSSRPAVAYLMRPDGLASSFPSGRT